jgi:divalent metal cation (Fe/Co/Zn/Cd) transporter
MTVALTVVVVLMVVGVPMLLEALDSLHRGGKTQAKGNMTMAPLMGVAVHQRAVAMF